MSVKHALTDHPIHALIAGRFSPYGFAPERVPDEDLRAIFEAARWAPSSYNEQPWRYIVATNREEAEFARLLSCLVEGNQSWARFAPVLALGVTTTRFARNDKPNAAARHDLGLASAHLTFEATARGFAVHQMIGIVPDRARELYGIPDASEALTALAIGRAADPDTLDERLRERDLTPRTRKPLTEFVFQGAWRRPAQLLDDSGD